MLTHISPRGARWRNGDDHKPHPRKPAELWIVRNWALATIAAPHE
jgi:hypothetical protein